MVLPVISLRDLNMVLSRRTATLTIFMSFIVSTLGGCVAANLPVAQRVFPCQADVGTVVQETFLVSVDKIEWTNRLVRVGMENLPENQLAALGEQAYARPRAGFLKIGLRIENTGKTPVSWMNPYAAYGKSYQVINKDGITYEYDPNLSSITLATSQGNQNPGIPVTGTVAFDVPKDAYDFVILHERLTGPGRTWRRTQVFRCSIV